MDCDSVNHFCNQCNKRHLQGHINVVELNKLEEIDFECRTFNIPNFPKIEVDYDAIIKMSKILH